MHRKAFACICCMLIALAMVGGEAFADTSSPANGGTALVGGSTELPDPMVYADGVEVGSGSEIAIPVKVWGNTGIMGFRVTVKYDPDALSMTNVSSGQLTSEGLFNNSMGQKKRSFDVLWSGSEPMQGDGVLFTLYAKAKDAFAGTTKIKLSYQQVDTFNEEFEDVRLVCKDIVITCNADGIKQVLDEDPVAEYLATEITGEVASQLDGASIAAALDNVLAQNNATSIADMTDDQAKEALQDIVKKAKDAGYDTKQVQALLDRVQETGESGSNAGASGAYKAALEQLSQAATAEAEEEPISVAEAIGDQASSDEAAKKDDSNKDAVQATDNSQSADSSDARSQEAAEGTQESDAPNLGVIAIGALAVIAILVGVLAYARRNRGHE